MHAGQVIRGDDLKVVRWPRSIAPAGCAHAVTGLLGRRAASAISAGEPLTLSRVVGSGLTLGLPHGTEAMSVPAADPRIADFVAIGDRVDLYALAPDELSSAAVPRHVASGVSVLAVLPPPADSGSQQGGASAELVVAVNAATAPQIAVNSRQMFAVVVDPP